MICYLEIGVFFYSIDKDSYRRGSIFLLIGGGGRLTAFGGGGGGILLFSYFVFNGEICLISGYTSSSLESSKDFYSFAYMIGVIFFLFGGGGGWVLIGSTF